MVVFLLNFFTNQNFEGIYIVVNKLNQPITVQISKRIISENFARGNPEFNDLRERNCHANQHHIIQREPASSGKKGVLVGLGCV